MADGNMTPGDEGSVEFTSIDCDIIEVNEETTQPGTASNSTPDGESFVEFTSIGCDIIEANEENTQPGTVSESFRKRLAERYGKKTPPTGPAEPPKQS